MAGRLVVVGTPIGNLGDLSPRAADALREADLVVAEDTRVAAKLLRFIGARRPTQSFTEHNAAERLPGLLDRLAAGDTLALTTDAGMPAVSDPGAELVAAARAAGHEVTVVPGPSAVTAALALAGVSGAAGTGFLFGGFLPARPASARHAEMERLVAAAASVGLPLILFEAPHRVRRLLEELADLVDQHPGLQVAAGRELTKLHEEVVAGTPSEVAAALPAPRGEFTVVASGFAPAEGAAPAVDAHVLAAAARAAGLSDRSVVEILRAAGIGRREAYALAQSSHSGSASRK
ncbi:MAG TPA: 16S rRNA (cytidine(1402)-2'-O)-methyltransferase [Candidatus Limnocylindria bacterium]|jgi:16S rRNA (cytidine1402-2'-O)-methyltransferase|nr:16S rRNA (cytidine(1402)-2'-O)-methyltransferase [Candidatus Limnocylindria bacterium]